MVMRRDLGLRPYEEVWDLQKQTQHALIAGTGPEAIFLCQHPPTITLGKSAKRTHILVDESVLAAHGVSLFEVERGGDVTFHGPGQAVAYPIVDLRRRRKDVDWYMRLLEQAIIDTCREFGVDGARIAGKTGVWVLDRKGQAPRKIASLGVRISRWCTLHGVALNVGSEPQQLSLEQGFSFINPCGLGTVQITSVAQESASPPPTATALEVLGTHLSELLHIAPSNPQLS